MPVSSIILLRHGHRLPWTFDPDTQTYSNSSYHHHDTLRQSPTGEVQQRQQQQQQRQRYKYSYPTGLPADPPLSEHGVRQSWEVARYLLEDDSGRGEKVASDEDGAEGITLSLHQAVREDRVRVYSSLFYRCLETLRPFVQKARELQQRSPMTTTAKSEETPAQWTRPPLRVRGETGVGEWFGSAPFTQPKPSNDWDMLDGFFPWLDNRNNDNNNRDRKSLVVPAAQGESIAELHARIARALKAIVEEVEAEYEQMGRMNEDVLVLICGHAAGIIASGRALTGKMPVDWGQEDFQCFTCGLSLFVRKRQGKIEKRGEQNAEEGNVASGARESEDAVLGSWECVLNSDCCHLSHGEERGWRFSGSETFDSRRPLRDTASSNMAQETSGRGKQGDSKVADMSKL